MSIREGAVEGYRILKIKKQDLKIKTCLAHVYDTKITLPFRELPLFRRRVF